MKERRRPKFSKHNRLLRLLPLKWRRSRPERTRRPLRRLQSLKLKLLRPIE